VSLVLRDQGFLALASHCKVQGLPMEECAGPRRCSQQVSLLRRGLTSTHLSRIQGRPAHQVCHPMASGASSLSGLSKGQEDAVARKVNLLYIACLLLC
jgi:hypothetical protein